MPRGFGALQRFFQEPEYAFGGHVPGMSDLSPEERYGQSLVVFLDVPFDLTSTGGRTSARGPEAVRYASAKMVELYDCLSGRDLPATVPWADLGTYRAAVPKEVEEQVARAIASPAAEAEGLPQDILTVIDAHLASLKPLPDIAGILYRDGKIPFAFLGEHYPTALLVQGLLQAREDERHPFAIVHLDAHRDMKADYLGMRRCHTTPFYEILEAGFPGERLIQVGIRQAAADEDEYARAHGVHTLSVQDIRRRPDASWDKLYVFTEGTDLYVSLDIDSLSSEFTPSTGTPVPFGLSPDDVVGIFGAIHPTARLVGADVAEVGFRGEGEVRDGDVREAVAAWILAQKLLQKVV
ncbi:MAG: arginase family protein [Candidatus Aenigmarchaeota archaeon]|nr:arginase family protein [Candidatus Aenigmarchaeota archaeon]